MGELAVTQERETEAGSEVAKQSGRYQIEPSRAGQSQPVAATPEASPPQPMAAGSNSANSAILAVHRLSEEELTWIEERTNKVPAKLLATVRPLPIIAPATPANTNATDDEPPTLGALRPYYREPTLERVQLQFEDKSLEPWQNPLAISSLQPPPVRGFARLSQLPGLQNALIGVGALALIGVGYLAAVASTGGGSAANDRGSVTTFAPARESGATRIEVAAPEDVNALRVVANKAPARVEEPPAPEAKDDSLQTEPLWSSPTPIEPPAGAPGPTAQAEQDDAARTRALRPLRAKAPTASPASTGLPMQPSRDDIKGAVESVRATLQACAGTSHGLTTARITILGTGRVAIANIEGAFAGTPEGSCMARALRSAAFPRFSAPTLQVTYPFRL